MLALVAAVLFAIGLIFDLAGLILGTITATTFLLAGALCLALYMADIGPRHWRR